MVRFKPPTAGDRRPVRQADRRQQRALLRGGAVDPRQGAQAYADFGMGRSRGTLPFQLARQHQARRPGREGLRRHACASSSRISAAARPRGGRSAPCRSAARSAPIFRRRMFDPAAGLRGLRRREAHGRPWRHRGVRRHASIWPSRRASPWSSAPIESCGKCTPCRIGSTRGVEVIDQIIAGSDRDAESASCSTISATS